MIWNSNCATADVKPLNFVLFGVDEEFKWRFERILKLQTELEEYRDDEKYARGLLGGLVEELGWFLGNEGEEVVNKRIGSMKDILCGDYGILLPG